MPESLRRAFNPQPGDEVLIYREFEEGEASLDPLIADGVVLSRDSKDDFWGLRIKFKQRGRTCVDNFGMDEIQPPLHDRHLFIGW